MQRHCFCSCYFASQWLEVATMMTLRSILFPTDFSDVSAHVFRFACRLARDLGAPLYVLHVSTGLEAVKGERFSDDHWEQYLTDEWHKLEQLTAEGVEIRRDIEEGAPAEQIVLFARKHGCELIVMGTHGREGLGHLLMGSVAERVIRQANCPVITLRASFAPALEGTPPRKKSSPAPRAKRRTRRPPGKKSA
jgi:universal stress protein A